MHSRSSPSLDLGGTRGQEREAIESRWLHTLLEAIWRLCAVKAKGLLEDEPFACRVIESITVLLSCLACLVTNEPLDEPTTCRHYSYMVVVLRHTLLLLCFKPEKGKPAGGLFDIDPRLG